MLFSLRSICMALLLVLAAAVGVSARAAHFDLEGIPMGEYRLEPFGEYGVPQKRVPSAGDMMVRFGKRGAV